MRRGDLALGLLANCSSLLGMVGGVQHSGPDLRPLRVGLVYLDAHGDFNTPETTLSGMLGGNGRGGRGRPLPHAPPHHLEARFPRFPPSEMILAGVRDTDPLEQQLIHEYRGAAPLGAGPPERFPRRFREALAALSSRVDRIDVHVRTWTCSIRARCRGTRCASRTARRAAIGRGRRRHLRRPEGRRDWHRLDADRRAGPGGALPACGVRAVRAGAGRQTAAGRGAVGPHECTSSASGGSTSRGRCSPSRPRTWSATSFRNLRAAAAAVHPPPRPLARRRRRDRDGDPARRIGRAAVLRAARRPVAAARAGGGCSSR